MSQRPNHSARTPLLALVAGLALTMAACHAESDTASAGEPRHAELASLQGTMVEVIPTQALEQDELHLIASYLEQRAGAEQVKVKLRQDSEDNQHLEVELWGAESLPTTLHDDLRDKFPQLADAEITQANLNGPPIQDEDGLGPAPHIDKNADPETVKSKIIADMRAKGVEGDIHVDVKDVNGERRVEVRVEREESSPH